MNVVALLRRDLQRYFEAEQCVGTRRRRWRIVIESLLFKSGFHAVLLYRASHSLFRARLTWCAWAITRFNQMVTGAEIEFSARIGPGLLIAHAAAIVIGRGTEIGNNATVFQGVTCGIRSWHGDGRAYPRIGHDVVLCAHASVLGNVRVGDNATIGAHCLVTADVPAGAMTRGARAECVLAEAV